MNTTIGTTQATLNIAATSSTRDLYYTKFVSEPIYQTSVAANTWTYAFTAMESSLNINFPVSANNKSVYVNCYVWKPSNGTKYGTILDGNTAATVDEGTANAQLYHIVTFTGSSVAGLTSGDAVIVIEIWFRITSTATGSQTFYYDGTTEYAENGTSTSAASYISTPENLAFTPATPQNIVRALPTETVAISESVARSADKLRGFTTTKKGIKTSTTADNGFFPLLSGTAGTDATMSLNITASGQSNQWTTDNTDSPINLLDWPGGTYRWRLRVVTPNANLTLYEIRIERYSSNVGAFRANKVTGITPNINMGSAGTYTGSITWDDGTQNPAVRAVNDILLINFIFSVTGAPQTLVIGKNLTNNNDEIDTPLGIAIETFIISDGVVAIKARAIAKSPAAETVTRSESIARRAAKTRLLATQTVSISDTGSPVRMTARARLLAAQTVALAENAVRIKGKIKALATQTVILGEAIAKQTAKTRPINQTITVSVPESLTKMTAKARLLAAQTVALSDSVTKLRSRFVIKSLSDTITKGESIARIANKIRTRLGLETVTANESVARLNAKNRPLTTQTVTVVGGTTTRVKGAIKTIPQTIILGESLVRLATKTRAIATQTIIVGAGILVRLKTVVRSLAIQTIAATGQVAQVVTPFAVGAVVRSITQTVSVSENIARLKSLSRGLSDVVPRDEAVAKSKGVQKALSQVLTIVETLARIKSSIRAISQTLSISDSPNRLAAKIRTLSQTTALSQTLTLLTSVPAAVVRTINEIVTVGDQVIRATNVRVVVRALAKEIVAITHKLPSAVRRRKPLNRRVVDSSEPRLRSNHPAYFMGSSRDDSYIEF